MEQRNKTTRLILLNGCLVSIGILFSFYSATIFPSQIYYQWSLLLLFLSFFAVPLLGINDALNMEWLGYDLETYKISDFLKDIFDFLSVIIFEVTFYLLIAFFLFPFTLIENLFFVLLFLFFNLYGFFLHFFNSFAKFDIPIIGQIIQKGFLFLCTVIFFNSQVTFVTLFFFLLISFLIEILFYFSLIISLLKNSFENITYKFSIFRIFSKIKRGFPITIQGLLNLLLINIFRIILSSNDSIESFNAITLLTSFFSILIIFLATFSQINIYKIKKEGSFVKNLELIFTFLIIISVIFLFLFNNQIIKLLELLFPNFTFSRILLIYSLLFVFYSSFNTLFTYPLTKIKGSIKFINSLLVVQLLIAFLLGYCFTLEIFSETQLTIFFSIIIIFANLFIHIKLFKFYFLSLTDLLFIILLIMLIE